MLQTRQQAASVAAATFEFPLVNMTKISPLPTLVLLRSKLDRLQETSPQISDAAGKLWASKKALINRP